MCLSVTFLKGVTRVITTWYSTLTKDQHKQSRTTGKIFIQFTRPVIHPKPNINKPKRAWTEQDNNVADNHTKDKVEKLTYACTHSLYRWQRTSRLNVCSHRFWNPPVAQSNLPMYSYICRCECIFQWNARTGPRIN